MVDRLNAVDGISCPLPQGAFYTFPKISALFDRRANGHTLSDSAAVVDYLLEAAGIAAVPGDAFGADDHMRLSYALSMEDLDAGLDRVEQAVRNLS